MKSNNKEPNNVTAAVENVQTNTKLIKYVCKYHEHQVVEENAKLFQYKNTLSTIENTENVYRISKSIQNTQRNHL
jgi:hypothetical protein